MLILRRGSLVRAAAIGIAAYLVAAMAAAIGWALAGGESRSMYTFANGVGMAAFVLAAVLILWRSRSRKGSRSEL